MLPSQFLQPGPSGRESAEARARRLEGERAALDKAYAEARRGNSLDGDGFDAWCEHLVASIPD